MICRGGEETENDREYENMPVKPPVWDLEKLKENASTSATNFRTSRSSPNQEWRFHYKAARQQFEALFDHLDNLNPHNFTDAALTSAYKAKHGKALRYLAGPPISEDDLKVIANVESTAPTKLGKNAEAMRKVFGVIEASIDPFRFPWVVQKRAPTTHERKAALHASSILLANQALATDRRNRGKTEQETQVKDFLLDLEFEEVPPCDIDNVTKGPERGQFCGECLVGERKADVVVRLHDGRLMPIECKVSNSATNSVKRLNNDAAAKAAYWKPAFGDQNIVPAAVLSGVFKPENMKQAQDRGLFLFWAHDLDALGDFIELSR